MKAAKYNLDAHRKKELSLLLGSVFFELDGHEANKFEGMKERGQTQAHVSPTGEA